MKSTTDKTLLKQSGNLPKITMTCDDAANIIQPHLSDARKQSTGTLNRLILVAQALESEVDSRRRSNLNSSRIIYIIRMANIILLVLVNALIFTGVGTFEKSGQRQSLMLTPNMWFYKRDLRLPFTFSEIRLTGQYLASVLSVTMLILTTILQLIHVCKVKHSKLMCICYSFGCVPFSLLIFGLEMHYSACPWLDDFYRAEIMRKDYSSIEKYIDTQCGISGWALSGIFALLSCGMFVSEGLITAFFRSDPHDNCTEKGETNV